MRRIAHLGLATIAAFLFVQGAAVAQAPTGPLQAVRATSADELRAWDAYVTARIRSGQLQTVETSADPVAAGRTVERLQQFHGGVPIWGADVVVSRDRGLPLAIFGEVAPDLTLTVEPSLAAGDAAGRLLALAGPGASLLDTPELVVLPLADGSYRLAWTGAAAAGTSVWRIVVDAQDGAELLRYSEIHTQSVGTGTGVLGDAKKISTRPAAGAFLTDDLLRPPSLRTFDMRGNLDKALDVIFGVAGLVDGDMATDTDNAWADVAAVDAHVHIGWTYDYFFKRFDRAGLDGANRPIVAVVNGVSQQGALNLAPELLNFAVNAFWCDTCGPGGVGVMYFGNGVPPGVYFLSNGHNYTYFAGALDIVAHELTHAVISSSSNLIYLNESGALNEAFADIMGTSVEFYFHPAGTGPGTADYRIGEDISRGIVPGALPNGDRDMANPALFGDPDHYANRFLGPEDNGGVHINSGIANHAFYLAVEGGVNATSGLGVAGVGAANREQIERVFYRAFTLLMPASSTFSTARAATIQAARDLYGAGSAVETAVTEAWTAVGVF